MLYMPMSSDALQRAIATVPRNNPIHTLLSAVESRGLSVMMLAPTAAKTPIKSVPLGCVVLIDDGDLTIEALGLDSGGPLAFDVTSLRTLLDTSATVVINGGGFSPKITSIAVFGSALGTSVLIETSDHFAEWVEFVLEARGGGAGVLASGPLDELPAEIQANILAVNLTTAPS